MSDELLINTESETTNYVVPNYGDVRYLLQKCWADYTNAGGCKTWLPVDGFEHRFFWIGFVSTNNYGGVILTAEYDPGSFTLDKQNKTISVNIRFKLDLPRKNEAFLDYRNTPSKDNNGQYCYNEIAKNIGKVDENNEWIVNDQWDSFYMLLNPEQEDPNTTRQLIGLKTRYTATPGSQVPSTKTDVIYNKDGTTTTVTWYNAYKTVTENSIEATDKEFYNALKNDGEEIVKHAWPYFSVKHTGKNSSGLVTEDLKEPFILKLTKGIEDEYFTIPPFWIMNWGGYVNNTDATWAYKVFDFNFNASAEHERGTYGNSTNEWIKDSNEENYNANYKKFYGTWPWHGGIAQSLCYRGGIEKCEVKIEPDKTVAVNSTLDNGLVFITDNYNNSYNIDASNTSTDPEFTNFANPVILDMLQYSPDSAANNQYFSIPEGFSKHIDFSNNINDNKDFRTVIVNRRIQRLNDAEPTTYTISTGISQFIAPYWSDTTVKPTLVYTKSRPTNREVLIYRWPVAKNTNTPSEICGYEVLLIHKYSGGYDEINKIIKGKPSNSWINAQINAKRKRATRNVAEVVSITINPNKDRITDTTDITTNIVVSPKDTLQLKVRAYTLDNDVKKYLSEEIISDEVEIQNSGIVHIRVGDSWVEGIVHVRKNNAWIEAESVHVYKSKNWIESE